jgi:hypothetical protein
VCSSCGVILVDEYDYRGSYKSVRKFARSRFPAPVQRAFSSHRNAAGYSGSERLAGDERAFTGQRWRRQSGEALRFCDDAQSLSQDSDYLERVDESARLASRSQRGVQAAGWYRRSGFVQIVDAVSGVTLYFDSIPGDGIPVTFEYELRAKFPVKAQAPASVAYQYYEPEIRDESEPVLLTVE